MHRDTLRRRALATVGCTTALVLAIANAAFADIYIYWKQLGGTLQVGVVSTEFAGVFTEQGGYHSSENIGGGESHMAIVCESGRCGIADDCKTCHTTPKPARTFHGPVVEQHRRIHFPRATINVGATPVPFESGFVQMMAGRMVLLDGNRTPTFRLPADARLLKDTRTGRPVFIVYSGRSAPEPVRQ